MELSLIRPSNTSANTTELAREGNPCNLAAAIKQERKEEDDETLSNTDAEVNPSNHTEDITQEIKEEIKTEDEGKFLESVFTCNGLYLAFLSQMCYRLCRHCSYRLFKSGTLRSETPWLSVASSEL